MGKIKRGGYLFITWIGDHGYHVHVFKDDRQVLKYDLENQAVINGELTERIRKALESLIKEGKL